MGIQSRRKKSRPRVGVGLTRWAARLPAEGLEPTRSCDHWILSPARLPVPPRRRAETKLQKRRWELKGESIAALVRAKSGFGPTKHTEIREKWATGAAGPKWEHRLLACVPSGFAT